MSSSTLSSPPMTMFGRTTSVAILIGSNATGGSTGGSNSNGNNNTVPVVVWANHLRPCRTSPTDPWKSTLEYYEFLEHGSCRGSGVPTSWNILDQLLLPWSMDSIHVALNTTASTATGGGASNKAKINAKNKQEQRILESLQVFLEERQARNDDEDNDTDNNNNNGPSNNESSSSSSSLHIHGSIRNMDTSKMESILTQLLLDDPSEQLAFRGNVAISQKGSLLQQGLALWLQAEGLSTSTSNIPDAWLHSLKLQRGLGLKSHLLLDRTAAQCIHLLPPPNAGMATVVGGQFGNNSLYGLLSHPCLTKMGQHKIQVWLRQPLVDLQAIQQRQEAIANLIGMGNNQLRETLKTFSSGGATNLHTLANTLGLYSNNNDNNMNSDESTTATEPSSPSCKSKSPLKALYELYLLASHKLPQLLDVLENMGTSGSVLLQQAVKEITSITVELERSQGLVEAVLDLEQAPREFLVKPEFQEELADLHRELENIHQQVEDELANMQGLWQQVSSSSQVIRLERVENDSAWQFRLPNTNDSKTLQTCLGKKVYIHRLLKNGVYFSTNKLQQLSSNYKDLQAEYAKHSQRIVQDAMAVATTYQSVVERAAEWVSTLDVLAALAYVADHRGYCRPTLTDSDENGAGIVLEDARHPCVELQEGMQDAYVANDISLVFGESNFLLVTGPNMGGKSTYIRSLGAIVCMAQIGSYVPCKSATINLCHSILARVGAGDLQERGISTFMAEMLEASSILRTATKRSLIIIDELGRGTSTFDGYGLARAISEYIMDKIGCMTVFATHFHELTHLPNVQNCHVTAQKGHQGLTFLYKVRPGPCLESFGIQVAEMANVPSCVIEDAKRKAAELEDFDSSDTATKSKKKPRKHNEFVQRFCALNLPTILKDAMLSKEQKQAKLFQLLA